MRFHILPHIGNSDGSARKSTHYHSFISEFYEGMNKQLGLLA